MTLDQIAALCLFAFVAIGTPGPNNVMLLASGANFGLRRTLPHILGINLGMQGMLVMTGLGLGALLLAAPGALALLKIASLAYLLWLAWKIAHAAAPGEAGPQARPMSLAAAALFQWVNPKAWAIALGGLAAYAPGQSPAAVAVVLVIFASLGPPLNTLWTLLGRGLRQMLRNPQRLRAFNWTMAALLVASMLPALWH
jgi:threonine/homoserine/homoserine lactone efflux protein